MKILLFNFDDVEEEILNISDISNEDFEEYANREGGFIFNSLEEFQNGFNNELFSTDTHQIRIINDEIGIQLHDKFSEEMIGTVLTANNNYELVCNKWDKYQEENNSESENEPDIYDFVADGNWEFCEVLEVNFYQPS